MLGSTLLAITIPLLKLPNLFVEPKESIVTTTMEPTNMEPIIVAAEVTSANWHINLLIWIYAIVSTFFLYKFLSSIFKLIRIKQRSRFEKCNGLKVYKTAHLNGSFSFFNWIFINSGTHITGQDEVIFEHEKAHVILKHSYDIVFIELFKVVFWWLPTAWYINKEIRKIHEYQADAYALRSCSDVEHYSSILINNTLKSNGLSLASSFDQSLILKRLKAMKQQTKKVKPWKVAALAALGVSLFIIFACTEEMDQEIKEMGSQSNAITYDQLPAEMQSELGSLQSQLSFLKVDVPEGKNTSEVMELQNLDPKLIHYIQVGKDRKTLYLALKKDEGNFNVLSDKTKMKGDIFTIVEDQPQFEGGMKAFYQYITSKLQYPGQARQQGIEGKVFVQFVVEKDGSLSNVNTVKGIGAGCDEEAVRVLKESPKWKPGLQRGRAVKVRMILPITFKLGEGENKDKMVRITVDEAQTDNKKLKVDANYSDGEWSGTVYDEDGKEMAGVNIIVHNTNTGTVSDRNGAFQLKAGKSKNVHFSFVGYESVVIEGK